MIEIRHGFHRDGARLLWTTKNFLYFLDFLNFADLVTQGDTRGIFVQQRRLRRLGARLTPGTRQLREVPRHAQEKVPLAHRR